MKPLSLIAILLAALALTIMAVAEDSQNSAGEAQPEMGPPQQIKDMAFMVGDWVYKGRMRMDPAAEWIEHEAQVHCEYVAGGGALMTEFNGMMLGMEMHGFGLTAYDREKGEWQDTWVDNWGGRISFYTGKDQDGKRVTSGTDMMGGKPISTRNTTYDITDTNFKWMMENSLDGENWFTSMEGEYIKKK